MSAPKKGSARRRAQRIRVNPIHRKVRERRNDILHQISHLLTAKAGVIKFAALNIKGMMRNPNLALSGCINTDMKNLNRHTFTCAKSGHVEGRDRNAARNVYWYGEDVETVSAQTPGVN